MRFVTESWMRIRSVQVVSPIGLLAVAGAILVAFGLCHALGFRANVSILSGSPPDATMSFAWAVTLGAAYALLYLETTPCRLIAVARSFAVISENNSDHSGCATM